MRWPISSLVNLLITDKIRDATVAVRHDPEMRAFYERLLFRGKRKKQALVAVAHKLRFGASTPNEPQADDGEVTGVPRGPVGPGGGLTGKTVSVPDPPWQDMLRMAQPIHPLSTTFLTP
jgi:hypothetical protein